MTYIVNDCQPKVLIVGPEFVSAYNEMKDAINVQNIISLEGADVSGAESYGLWEMDGALLVIDAQTLKEVKRIPASKPVGKYNVWNKISRSEGTSH